MRAFLTATFSALLLTFSSQSAFAMDSMSGSMMPSCASGDPAVGVNMMNKTYMTHDQMMMKTKGMSTSQMHAMMMKNHVKMMCMSKAKSMGAMMMHNKM